MPPLHTQTTEVHHRGVKRFKHLKGIRETTRITMVVMMMMMMMTIAVAVAI